MAPLSCCSLFSLPGRDKSKDVPDTYREKQVYSKETTKKEGSAKKNRYTRPEAKVERYSVERGFASSGSFEGLSNSSNSYNDSNFT